MDAHRHRPSEYPVIVPCRYRRPTAFGSVRPSVSGSTTSRSFRTRGPSTSGAWNSRSSRPSPCSSTCALSFATICALDLWFDREKFPASGDPRRVSSTAWPAARSPTSVGHSSAASSLFCRPDALRSWGMAKAARVLTARKRMGGSRPGARAPTAYSSRETSSGSGPTMTVQAPAARPWPGLPGTTDTPLMNCGDSRMICP